MQPQALADHLEIQTLLAKYCQIVDARDWDAFTALFTDDAILDFTAYGGPVAGPVALAGFIQTTTAALAAMQHSIATLVLDIHGDTATARCTALVTMVPAGEPPTLIGLWYRDELRRTAGGWRLSQRTQEAGWHHQLT